VSPRVGLEGCGEHKNLSPPSGFGLRTVRPVANRFSGPLFAYKVPVKRNAYE